MIFRKVAAVKTSALSRYVGLAIRQYSSGVELRLGPFVAQLVELSITSSSHIVLRFTGLLLVLVGLLSINDLLLGGPSLTLALARKPVDQLAQQFKEAAHDVVAAS